MSVSQVSVTRPQRWDTPFDPSMTDGQVDQLLKLAPFSEMDPGSFSKNLPLRGILQNDCRILNLSEGDIVIRQGDYGNSAFLILDGELLVSLVQLSDEVLGRTESRKKNWFQSLAQAWTNSRVAESRDAVRKTHSSTATRTEDELTRVFVQDIPATLNMNQTARMPKGQLFGELAAMTRTPRTATVIADGNARLLEMRWQGFRELLKRAPALREHVEMLYRENSLRGHLEMVKEFQGLPETSLQKLADAATFETYGNFEWNQKFKKLDRKDVAERILAEPVIADESHLADHMVLIRNGFARLSRQHGNGQQTIAYLGKGESFGFREIAHSWQTGEQRNYSLGLRAVGYVDVLKLPRAIVEEIVLPNLPKKRLPAAMPPLERTVPASQHKPKKERRQTDRDQEIESGLLEFLVENRFINGTEAMMIDLDRCTRCDDCVRACASTHDNNPRFIRQGTQHENWLIAGACMHCIDPVCMIGCPTGAIGRDESNGNVVINDETCIGCGTCSSSCPYENIRMVDIRDKKGKLIVDDATQRPIQKATKCDLCTEQPMGPACQNACPHDALYRIDLTNPLPVIQLTQS